MISRAQQGVLTSRIMIILVIMHRETGTPGSCSYIEFGRGSEPLIYKNPVSPSSDLAAPSSLRSRAHIYLFPFAVSIFPVPHRQSYSDGQYPLLPTALWNG
jgi:hypothetical protein